jgi:hypothetical protein
MTMMTKVEEMGIKVGVTTVVVLLVEMCFSAKYHCVLDSEITGQVL